MSDPVRIVRPRCRGEATGELASNPGLAWLEDLAGPIAGASRVLASGRNRVVCVEAPTGSGTRDVVVKRFDAPRWPKSISNRRIGSKAERSWRTARALEAAGVGTPAPLAWVDTVGDPGRLESYYVSAYVPDLVDMKTELIRLYRTDPICRKVMNLLERTAAFVRRMHDAGVQHRDLGNQNLLVHRLGEEDYRDVQVIDLNRARIKPSLTLVDRARDISRICLPSDLLRVWMEMYFQARAPEECVRWERRYRERYRLHSRTRRWRHPFRPSSPPPDTMQRYPDPRDLWIWDDRSAQAISVHRPRDRDRLRTRRDVLAQGLSTARALPGVWARYRGLLERSYLQPVDLRDRIGMAIDPGAGDEDREVEWLGMLGSIPALIRIYHHESKAEQDRRAALVERLASEGRPVAIALVQDRAALRDPDAWRRFGDVVLDRLHVSVDLVEIGHAVNRVKWGVWSWTDYAGLVAPIPGWKERHPSLQFVGPAAIDFEYPYTLTALSRLPKGVRLSGLSHHLYVDRRGAPENPQGSFSLLEKCALGRAIAGWSRASDDRLILSEANWPIRGTGVWSPVVSPHDTPGPRRNDPSVSEEEYAAYMIRYLLVALCSGLAERVYWWRLVARGFGLVDDTDPDAWRARPAFAALSVFLEQAGDATFLVRREAGLGSAFFLLRKPDGRRFVIGYSTVAGDSIRIPFQFVRALDAAGAAVEPGGGPVSLPGSPMYFLEVEGFGLPGEGP